MFKPDMGRLAVLLALVPLAAFATLVKDETIEEMTAHSPLVVRGVIKSSQPVMQENRAGIWTYAEVLVTETIKGAAPQQVLVKQPGGEVGAVGTHVSGTAKFVPGQECVLFLERAVDERGVFIVYAMAAGKVDLEERQGQAFAVRRLSGLAFAPQGTEAPKSRARKVGDVEFLGAREVFLARVRAAALGGGR